MTKKKTAMQAPTGPRSFGPDDLGRRYLRLRHEDTLHDESGRLHARVQDGDDFWDINDPGGECPEPGCECCAADAEELSGFHLERLLDDIVCSDTLPIVDYGEPINEEPVGNGRTGEPLPRASIEKRLAGHLGASSRGRFDRDKMYATIATAIKNPGGLRIIREYAERCNSPRLARRICLFAPFWLAEPYDWDPRGEISLLDHLFVRYDVPGFLYREWSNDQDRQPKWLAWFIIIGQGGSLHRAAEHFGWRIPARLPAHLAAAPSEVSPTLACLHAEVMRLGGTKVDFDRLIRNRWFVLDPTEYSANATHGAFWRDTVRWMSRHRDELTEDDASLVLDWALHEYTEGERIDAPVFSWRGRSARAAVARGRQYQAEIQARWPFAAGPDLQWRARGWSWQIERTATEQWSFVELTSTADLRDEGRALRHCVATYSARCAAGHSAIVSARRNDEPCLTIELAPRTRKIVQIRGAGNREATPDERQVIAFWQEDIATRYIGASCE
jgi:hypothetical protein